jgi:hypothetical protein
MEAVGNAPETHLRRTLRPSSLGRVESVGREKRPTEATEAKTGDSPRVAETPNAALGRVESVGRESRGGRTRHDGNDPARVVLSWGRLSDVSSPLAESHPQKMQRDATRRFRALRLFGNLVVDAIGLAAHSCARRRIGFVWRTRSTRASADWVRLGNAITGLRGKRQRDGG